MKMQLNGIYSFDLYPAAVVAATLNNAKVVSIMNGETAASYLDVMALHNSVRPYLPDGLSTNPLEYTYLRLITETGAETYVAYEWINEATITVVNSNTCTIKISPFDPAMLPALRQVLIQNGFTDIVSMTVTA